ncbi:MAG: GNAT family N-acetyltransferase [Chitinophagaceae bacterium]|nr:GNAT family N-acetyltransferase [Chitinophagaceae bacterium]
MSTIKIIDYRPQHQPYFEKFNRYWIEKYFVMEPVDEYVLTNPDEALLKPGGAILMATCDGEIAGTVALRKVDDSTFEFTKMAVDNKFQRRGIAESLSHASLRKAKELGAQTVILYSNSILTAAIRLYEKLGFEHVPVGIVEYKRSDVKMKIDVSDLKTIAIEQLSNEKFSN